MPRHWKGKDRPPPGSLEELEELQDLSADYFGMDIPEEPIFGTYEDMVQYMKEQYPTPEPKEIKHVVLDADDTMWEIEPWGIATLAVPIGKTDGDVLPVRINEKETVSIPYYWELVQPTGYVKLAPKLRETLAKLNEKGIPVSIASSNDKKVIESYLKAFGLRDKIKDVEANFYGSKDQMVEKIAGKNKVDQKQVLFVDDSSLNCRDVLMHTEATPLLLGYHIQNIDEILDYIK